ncbi:hypothetical protein F8M41_018423 [Gigaspora margarita]|uniref:Uncharacterized protein n=1 Tax=Gigaspora margarita TaxID=4874 RepID=A0A8H4EL80_GIGMA|nr:hypothetical protein F8M41_018423 [Gigaspora margarita]
MRPPAHYDSSNRRRNLPVRPSQKKSNNYEAYSIREEIKHLVNRYSKVEELYNRCVTLAKTLTDEQAANDVQFYEYLKIVLEILEDLIDEGRITKDIDNEPNSKADNNPEENEALKIVVKVAKMDHMDKIFESEDVKILDEEYYTEKAPDNELLEILWKNYSSPTACLDNIEKTQSQEINPEEEPLEPKLGPSLAEVLDKSDCETLVRNDGEEVSNLSYLTGVGAKLDKSRTISHQIAMDENNAKVETDKLNIFVHHQKAAKDKLKTLKLYMNSAKSSNSDGQYHHGWCYQDNAQIQEGPHTTRNKKTKLDN